MTLERIVVKPPDRPIHNEVSAKYLPGNINGTTPRTTIFTVEGSRATPVTPVDSGDITPVFVHPLPFHSYEFEEVKEHIVPTERGGPCYPPEHLALIFCVMNPFTFSCYITVRDKSISSYRAGNVREARKLCIKAYIALFVTIMTPVAFVLFFVLR